MKKNVTLQLAASTLVLGLTVVGCKPAGSGYGPAAVSAQAVKAEAEASKVYAKAQAAVQKADLPGALGFAETAVELSPRDTGYRMLLGDLYLKSGRFLSAENAFSDLLTLDPGNTRATLSLALAQVAQGKTAEAVGRLDSAANAAPVDVGLAYALAGQAQRAIQILEFAARAPEANGRVRQNLALAYAIAGDWQKARVTAAQDLAPAEVGKRMEEWASFAKPGRTHLQVATLLGTTPVADPGQPVRLALAPSAPAQAAYAEAETPAPDAAAAVADAPVIVAEAPAEAQVEVPVQVASTSTTEAYDYQPPEHGDVFETPASVQTVDVPAASAAAPAKVISATQFAAAVDTLVKAPAAVIKASAPVASAPIRAFVPQKEVRKVRSSGRYVVQIGAYRNAVQVEKAWAQAVRRYRFAREPMSTTVAIPGKGTFHRLAIAGFANPAEAAKRCGEIRVQGGTCFVRANAGDAPVQWASRYGRRA